MPDRARAVGATTVAQARVVIARHLAVSVGVDP